MFLLALLVSDDEPAALDGADAYFAAVYEWLDESTDFVGGAEVEGLAQFDGRNEGVSLQYLVDGRQGLLDGPGMDRAVGEAADGFTERIVADEVPDEHLPALIRQQIGGQGMNAEGVHAGQVAVKGGFGTAVTVVLKETLLVDACLAHDLQDFVEPRGGAGIDNGGIAQVVEEAVGQFRGSQLCGLVSQVVLRGSEEVCSSENRQNPSMWIGMPLMLSSLS